MTTQPLPDSDVRRLTQALTDLANTNHTLDILKQRKAELEDLVRTLIPTPVKAAQFGDHHVTITAPQRRLNNTALIKAYPVIQFPGFYKPTIDTAAVKKAISDQELEDKGLYTFTTPSVRVE